MAFLLYWAVRMCACVSLFWCYWCLIGLVNRNCTHKHTHNKLTLLCNSARFAIGVAALQLDMWWFRKANERRPCAGTRWSFCRLSTPRQHTTSHGCCFLEHLWSLQLLSDSNSIKTSQLFKQWVSFVTPGLCSGLQVNME